MMEEKNFKERYLAGEIPFEEIDRYISIWTNSTKRSQKILFLTSS